MLRHFSVSEIPFDRLRAGRHIKMPQRFFGGISPSTQLVRQGSPQVRAGHSVCAKRLKTHFFPEGRFMIFAGSRPGGMLQKS